MLSYHHVRRLDVAVNDALHVSVFDRERDLEEDLDEPGEREDADVRRVRMFQGFQDGVNGLR